MYCIVIYLCPHYLGSDFSYIFEILAFLNYVVWVCSALVFLIPRPFHPVVQKKQTKAGNPISPPFSPP